MKRTSAAALAIAAVLGAGAGFVIDQALTSAGRTTLNLLWSMPLLLLALAVIVLAFAIPIRRATRAAGPARINPFRAVRIAMLAKASSIVGAAVGGLAVGLLLFLATRPAVPSLGSMATTVATLVSAVVLVVAALVAEHLCTIRKDDDDDDPAGPDVAAPDQH